mgnify:FL=1
MKDMFSIENITKTIKETYFRIKDFLLKPKSREFFIFLFFLFLASGFWLLQTLKEEYEEDFIIPLVITHIPDNISLTNDPVDKLSVRIRDKGTLLANYKFRKFSPIELNFGKLSRFKEDHILLPSSVVEKEVLDRFNNSSKLVSIKPDSLEVIFTKGEPKEVPVAIRGDIEANLNYLVSDTVIEPPYVSIVAPSYQLKEIDTVYTEPLELLNLKDTARVNIPLHPIKGVKYTPREVSVSISVDILTEKTVRVPLRGINFPADKRLRTFPSYADITFQIGTAEYNSVTAKDFAIDIDYWELRQLDEETYRIKVTQAPSNIKRMRLSSQERVDFLIEKKSINSHD